MNLLSGETPQSQHVLDPLLVFWDYTIITFLLSFPFLQTLPENPPCSLSNAWPHFSLTINIYIYANMYRQICICEYIRYMLISLNTTCSVWIMLLVCLLGCFKRPLDFLIFLLFLLTYKAPEMSLGAQGSNWEPGYPGAPTSFLLPTLETIGFPCVGGGDCGPGLQAKFSSSALNAQISIFPKWCFMDQMPKLTDDSLWSLRETDRQPWQVPHAPMDGHTPKSASTTLITLRGGWGEEDTKSSGYRMGGGSGRRWGRNENVQNTMHEILKELI